MNASLLRRSSWWRRLALAASLTLFPSALLAGDFAGDVNFLLGQKLVDKEDWGGDREQGEFGVEMSWGNTDWPIRVATDILWSGDFKNDPFEDTVMLTGELDVGVRKIWDAGRTRPYLAGGLGIISGYVNNDFFAFEEDDWDAEVGPWANAGILWRLGAKFNFGFSFRWSDADVELLGETVQAGGFQYGLVIGFGWPGYHD